MRSWRCNDDGSGSSGRTRSIAIADRTRADDPSSLTSLRVTAAVSWIGGMGFYRVVLVPVLKREGLLGRQTALFRAIALRFHGSPCFC